MTRFSFVTDANTARLAASRLITVGAYVEVAPIEDGQVAVSVDEAYRDLLDQAAAEVLVRGTSLSLKDLVAAVQHQLPLAPIPALRDKPGFLQEVRERLEHGKPATKAATASLLALADHTLTHANITYWYPALVADWNAICEVFEHLGLKIWGDTVWHYRWADGHEGHGFAELTAAILAAFSGAQVVFAGEP